MPFYRHPEATGRPDEITVIEDSSMVEKDETGAWQPTFAFVDSLTIKAHPTIVDSLVEGAERLWTLEELLVDLEN